MSPIFIHICTIYLSSTQWSGCIKYVNYIYGFTILVYKEYRVFLDLFVFLATLKSTKCSVKYTLKCTSLSL